MSKKLIEKYLEEAKVIDIKGRSSKLTLTPAIKSKIIKMIELDLQDSDYAEIFDPKNGELFDIINDIWSIGIAESIR
jgi:hypothetical protein